MKFDKMQISPCWIVLQYNYWIGLATIEVCVFVRRLRSSHFCFLGEAMNEKLIYEKEYPHSAPRVKHVPNEVEITEFPSDNFCFGTLSSTRYTIIPERYSRSEEFINEVIRISELYRMNARIVRHYEKISAHLAFDFGEDISHINRLFGMADRISISEDNGNRDVLVYLEFYTHVVVKSGMSIAP